MKIQVVQPIGYCAGVTRAINIALSCRDKHPNKNIYILGQLVHNHHVEELLSAHRIITLLDKPSEELLNSIKENAIIIFTAHGHDEKLDILLDKIGIPFYDATCPIVKLNNEKIKKEISNGHQVIYIGKKSHAETLASLSINHNVLPFYGSDFDYSLVKDDSPLIINQTTLNIEELADTYNEIQKHIPNARINKEVCETTRKRQTAIINLEKDVDVIFIVGDSNSSNSLRLFEVAKKHNPGALVQLIENISDIDLNLLKNKKHLAIASGASTPIELINRIIDYIK